MLTETPAPHPTETRAEIGFVLRLARALHSYGIPAHRLEEILERAAQKLGLEGQFFSTPTSIIATVNVSPGIKTMMPANAAFETA